MTEPTSAPDPGPAQISDWAEMVAAELIDALLKDDLGRRGAALFAATADPDLARQVLITLSRTAGLLLRPRGHAGGPIGHTLTGFNPEDPALLRAAQLIGFAAQDDAAMVDALAIATATVGPNPLQEARTVLWGILQIIATEPIQENP